jgi:hypothetical protein
MRAVLLHSLGLLLSATTMAYGQPAPFDMSPERPREVEPPSIQMPAPRRVSPPPVAQPAPTTQPGQLDQLPRSAAPSSAPATPEPARPAEARRADGSRRYIIPSKSIVLEGEHDRRSWSVYLTAEQAGAPARLSLSYQNAIVVAPEASTLTLFVNSKRVGQENIAAPNSAKTVSWAIPPHLLQAGSNVFTLVAEQRHRTDCDVRSTYDLWTEFASDSSFLIFDTENAGTTTATEAVRSIGADGTGTTHFHMVLPTLGSMNVVAPLMRLSQGLAVLSGMPNQNFSFSSALPQGADPGHLPVIVGTPAELDGILPQLPPGAASGPVSGMVNLPGSSAEALVVSGPSWTAIASAVESLIAPVLRPVGVRRDILATERWTTPEAPFLFGGEELTFSQLGLENTEFSGRRLRMFFNIAVPADFYADAYGEATILLDAAYADSVEPGSHIEVYVNGNIASTVPITSDSGGLFRRFPIHVTMRHFKPGLNRIALEAIVTSPDDRACEPGATSSKDPRIAIFESSTFRMPRYARIGQVPNLAALTGTGFPYNRSTEPTALFIDRVDPDILSATANFLARTALVAGLPLAVEPVATASALRDRHALFVGTASQIPAMILSQLNLNPVMATTWRTANGDTPPQADTAAAFEQWQDRLRGGTWRSQIDTAKNWLRERFDLSGSALQFVPRQEIVFTPPNQDNLMLAQGPNASGTGVWTVLAGPTSADLNAATATLVRDAQWTQISGRVTTLREADFAVTTFPAERRRFLPFSEQTFANYRLIAANWLSSNILSYALLMLLGAGLLGLTTGRMLSKFGRHK